MKTQRTLTAATVVAILSYGIGAFLTVPASHGATTGVDTHAPKPAAMQSVNARIQQELQRELEQRARTHPHTLSSIARIHHEFALKDAEIRKLHAVIAHKDSLIKRLRGLLGISDSGS